MQKATAYDIRVCCPRQGKNLKYAQQKKTEELILELSLFCTLRIKYHDVGNYHFLSCNDIVGPAPIFTHRRNEELMN